MFPSAAVAMKSRTSKAKRPEYVISHGATNGVPYILLLSWSRSRFEIVAPGRFGLACLRLKSTDAANEELR